MLKELKAFRLELQSNFTIPNLTASYPAVRNEGKYSRVEFFYPSAFTQNATLRPHILFEFTLSNIRCDIVTRSVKSLMEDTFPSLSLFPQRQTHCVAVHETAIAEPEPNNSANVDIFVKFNFILMSLFGSTCIQDTIKN